MTLPLELGAVTDDYARRALELVAQRFPIGPADLVGGTPGTTLPTAPTNGQDYYYQLSSGGVWHLKYNATAAKWDLAGGPPLIDEVVTAQTTASLTYAALATAGPSIAVPIAGDYIVTIGCRASNNTAATQTFMSYDIGATGAVDADALFNFAITDATTGDFGVRARKKTGLTAVTLTAKYRVTGGTGSFESRWMQLLPVRVG